MRKAFTLIELSIVLVIIGLLVGGVLIGRDLVNAATVKNFVSTLEKFNAGGATFRAKYRNLPGDIGSASANLYGFTPRSDAVGHGDGNGIIEGCALLSQRLGCETALFWSDLYKAHVNSYELVTATDAPVDGTAGGFTIDNYLPPTPFRNNTQVFLTPFNSRNVYYVGRISAVASDGTLTTAPALTPQEARDIDDKVDDGYPSNGIARAMSSLSTYDTGGVPSITTCVNNTLPQLAYDLLDAYSSSVSCQISIRSQL